MCSYLSEGFLLLLDLCFTDFLPNSCLAGLSTVTGGQCSNACSGMLFKMADLDKAAGKGWDMGMERKAMRKQRERMMKMITWTRN